MDFLWAMLLCPDQAREHLKDGTVLSVLCWVQRSLQHLTALVIQPPWSADNYLNNPSPDSISPGATDHKLGQGRVIALWEGMWEDMYQKPCYKTHSSVGLIVGVAHSLFIASSVMADLDGLMIKARQNLRRQGMPFTASAQLTWLKQPATFQATEPWFGLFSRAENNSSSHKLMPLQLLLLSSICHFPREVIILMGDMRREMQDCHQPAPALQTLLLQWG